MPKACGKYVQKLRIIGSKSSEMLFTVGHIFCAIYTNVRTTSLFIHRIIRIRPHGFYYDFSVNLSLLKPYFSPSSTLPITTNTNLKI